MCALTDGLMLLRGLTANGKEGAPHIGRADEREL